MQFINTIFGVPLGYVMYFCYLIVKNYGFAIIIFTLLSKIILFPVSVLVQKNSIKMVKIKPKLDEIARRYAGDKDRIAEEQIVLYDAEKYNASMGFIPLLIQIPFVLGLVNVIYNPLQHILHISQEIIQKLLERTQDLLGVSSLGNAPQLKILEAIVNPQFSPFFDTLSDKIPEVKTVLESIRSFDMRFLGFDLSVTPNFSAPVYYLFIPLLSGFSAFIMCYVQNKINVLQREQSKILNSITLGFIVLFSTYITFWVPTGVGVYWIFSNLFSVLVSIIVNTIWNPKKYIEYENRYEAPVLTKEEKKLEADKRRQVRERQRQDNKRFQNIENKQLVFFSEKSGFYKYFENMIGYILDNSDVIIHYVTLDPNDAIFQHTSEKIIPYYIGDKAIIPFMMKMDADIVVMTTPDLQNYFIKRSLVRKNIEYIYTFHGLASTHMVVRQGAYDHFDTIFCVGQHQIDELRMSEKLYNLPAKNLLPVGYGLIDNLVASYESHEVENTDKKTILVASSWQADNLVEDYLDKIVEQLNGKGYTLIIRPHPEFIKRFPDKLSLIKKKYANLLDSDFILESDFSSNRSIFASDLLITDWSGIAFEFSYTTKKPSLFINTTMKVLNEDYTLYPMKPLDITLRDEVGVSLDVDQLDTLYDTVASLFNRRDAFKEQIHRVMDRYLFHLGHSGEIAGKYILESLKNKPKDFE